MIEDYLKQEATFYIQTGKTSHGDLLYGLGSTVKCRISGKLKLIQSPDGSTVQSECVIWMLKPSKMGDKLSFYDKDWTILSAEPKRNLEGGIEFWEVLV